jgi:class 3 adenylate cyclase
MRAQHDLSTFDLVRSHFGALTEAVAEEGGAVIKTIGDAVMATFQSPTGRCALRCGCARGCAGLTQGRRDVSSGEAYFAHKRC